MRTAPPNCKEGHTHSNEFLFSPTDSTVFSYTVGEQRKMACVFAFPSNVKFTLCRTRGIVMQKGVFKNMQITVNGDHIKLFEALVVQATEP